MVYNYFLNIARIPVGPSNLHVPNVADRLENNMSCRALHLQHGRTLLRNRSKLRRLLQPERKSPGGVGPQLDMLILPLIISPATRHHAIKSYIASIPIVGT